MSDFINLSRVEAILRDGANYSGPILSRVEQLLYELVQSIGGQSFDGPYESVEDLPNPGSTGVIYLVETGDEDDYYDEYYWDANRETYEFLGSSRIDLSNYVTKSEFDAAISAINGDISDEISARQAIGRRLDATIDILDDTVYSEAYDSYEDMVTSVTDPIENALYKVKSGNIVKEYCYEAGSTEVVEMTSSPFAIANDDSPANAPVKVTLESKGSMTSLFVSGVYLGIHIAHNYQQEDVYNEQFAIAADVLGPLIDNTISSGDVIIFDTEHTTAKFIKASDSSEIDITSAIKNDMDDILHLTNTNTGTIPLISDSGNYIELMPAGPWPSFDTELSYGTAGGFIPVGGDGTQSDWNESDSSSPAYIQNKPTIPDITGKADKVTSATSGNFAGLDANGNLTDSGHKHSDYLTQHQDITGKADKVSGATNGNFAALDSNGNLTDSGHKHGDYLTQHQDISGKADLTVIALAFNNMVSYTPGMYATYEGKLYRFKAPKAPGAWDSTKVDQVQVAGQYVNAGKKISTNIGNFATAEGLDVTASGVASHASGYETIAQRRSQTVIGEYNEADNTGADGSAKGKYVFIVGIGDENGRLNGFTIDWDGKAEAKSLEIADGAKIYKSIYSFQLDSSGIHMYTGPATGVNITSAALTVNEPETNLSGDLNVGGDVSDGSGNVLNEMFWKGTSSEWTALPAATKAKYAGKPVYLTDDAGVYTGMPQPYRFTLTGTGSVVTTTFSHASITADMRVIDSTISNPSAVLSDMTITPANGSLTVSATVNGTTEVLLIMQPCRSAIDLT